MPLRDEQLEEKLHYFLAQTWHEELTELALEARKKSPRNQSKFAPAQLVIQKLKTEEKFRDAIYFFSSTYGDVDEDPVEALIKRLSAVKNPHTQGRGIKKTYARRPNRKKKGVPLQLTFNFGRQRQEILPEKIPRKRIKKTKAAVQIQLCFDF